MDDARPQAPELHPLVQGFDDAETYDRGRPRYDDAVARVLIDGLELAAGAPVLELGAGTGQLSGALVEAGLDLTAVEPLGPTRDLLARAIGPERVREGVAEQIPLADGSVEGVFAADAFHWFDETRAMPEIKRVLRPGGGVGILRTVPSWDMPWARELGEIMMAATPPHPAFDGRGPAAALEEDADFGTVLETSTTSSMTMDRERMRAYIGSMSWVATLTPSARGELLAKVDELLDRHGFEQATHDVRHQIWIARLV
jgi:SAM-dependent methyltransferase